MGLSHSPTIVTDGLVLCLDAADKRSYPGTGTTWTDRSGNNHHGPLTNGPAFTSDNGGILTFDGTDDYMQMTTSPTFKSIEVWAKYNNVGQTGWKYFFDARTGISDGYWTIVGNYQSSAFNIYKNAIPVTRQWGFTAYEWTHMYFYSDGTAYTDDIVFCSNHVYGERTGFSISQIRMYDKVLSADEVRRNYLATKGRFE